MLNSLAIKWHRIGIVAAQMSRGKLKGDLEALGNGVKVPGNTDLCHQYHLALGYLNLYQVG